MKGTALLHFPVTLLFLAVGAGVRGADDPAPPDPAPPPGFPSREELREKLKGLTPAERQSKIKELREKAGATGVPGELVQQRRAELEKFRESIKDLPPAGRQAKMLEWRQQHLGALGGPGAMPPAERETLRKQFGKRIEKQIEVLKEKKANGSITEMETRRLRRMEEMASRLESPGAPGGSGGLGLPVPRPSVVKPEAPGEAPAKPVKPSEVK